MKKISISFILVQIQLKKMWSQNFSSHLKGHFWERWKWLKYLESGFIKLFLISNWREKNADLVKVSPILLFSRSFDIPLVW